MKYLAPLILIITLGLLALLGWVLFMQPEEPVRTSGLGELSESEESEVETGPVYEEPAPNYESRPETVRQPQQTQPDEAVEAAEDQSETAPSDETEEQAGASVRGRVVTAGNKGIPDVDVFWSQLSADDVGDRLDSRLTAGHYQRRSQTGVTDMTADDGTFELVWPTQGRRYPGSTGSLIIIAPHISEPIIREMTWGYDGDLGDLYATIAPTLLIRVVNPEGEPVANATTFVVRTQSTLPNADYRSLAALASNERDGVDLVLIERTGEDGTLRVGPMNELASGGMLLHVAARLMPQQVALDAPRYAPTFATNISPAAATSTPPAEGSPSAPMIQMEVQLEMTVGVTVSGRVIDQHGQGVAYATVTAGLSPGARGESEEEQQERQGNRYPREDDYWQDALTDAEGNFTLQGLVEAPGDAGQTRPELLIRAGAEGYEPGEVVTTSEPEVQLTLTRRAMIIIDAYKPDGTRVSRDDGLGIQLKNPNGNPVGDVSLEWYRVTASGEAVNADGTTDATYEQPGTGENRGQRTQREDSRREAFRNLQRGRLSEGVRQLQGTAMADRRNGNQRQADADLPGDRWQARLINVPGGTYTITASLDQAAPTTPPEVTVEAGSTQTVRIDFRAGGTITGTVTGTDGPVRGARLFLTNGEAGTPVEELWSEEVQSNREGVYTFSAVPVQRLFLRAVQRGYLIYQAEIMPVENEETVHDVQLDAGLVIEGQVRYEDNRPLTGRVGVRVEPVEGEVNTRDAYERGEDGEWTIDVNVFKEAQYQSLSMRTDYDEATQRYVASGLAPGLYDVRAWMDGAQVDLQVDAGTRNADLVFPTPGELIITVVDENTRPFAGVSLQLNRQRASATTGNDGTAIFPALGVGTYEIEARLPESEAGTINRTVEIRNGERSQVTLTIARPVLLRAQVVRNGQPVAGERTLLFGMSEGMTRYQGQTDENGWFTQTVFPGSFVFYVDGARPEIKVPSGQSEVTMRVELPSGSIRGTVRDMSGNIVTSGWVLLRAVGDNSDVPTSIDRVQDIWSRRDGINDQGEFEFEGLGEGEYVLYVRPNNGDDQPDGAGAQTVQLGSNQQVTLALRMTPAATIRIDMSQYPSEAFSTVEIDVRDELGARLPRERRWRGRDVSDDGVLDITHVPGGRYTVTVSADGFATLVEEVVVGDSGQVVVTPRPEPEGSILIVVNGPSSAPTGTLNWRILDSDGNDISVTRDWRDLNAGGPSIANQAGFRVFGLGADRYTVEVSDDAGQYTGSATITVTAGSITNVTISLQRTN